MPTLTLKLKQILTDVLLNNEGKPYIQLTGLDDSGAVWVMGTNKWQPLSMETESTEDRAAGIGLKVVN